MTKVDAQKLLKRCKKALDEGDMFEAELTLTEFFESPGQKDERPLRRFNSHMEKLGVLFLTMGLRGTRESVAIWNELRATGMTSEEIAEEFELDSAHTESLELGFVKTPGADA